MDVTFSPVAGASLRPDGASDDGSGATDPSFDLFLDFNQSVAPNVEPVEPAEDNSLSDREALRRVTGREDADSDRHRSEDESERTSRVDHNAETNRFKQDESTRVRADSEGLRDHGSQDDSHSADSSSKDDSLAQESRDGSDQSKDDDSLAGAQNASGASEQTKDVEVSDEVSLRRLTDAETIGASEEKVVLDEKSATQDEVHTLEEATIEDLSDGRFQKDPAVAQSVQLEQDSKDGVESSLGKSRDLTASRFDGAAKSVAQTFSQEEVVQNSEANLLKTEMGDAKPVDSRFSEAAVQQLASDTSKPQNGDVDQNSVDHFNESDMLDAEWSRLLKQDSPTEKLARATGARLGDSVQLSAAGTKATGDGGGVRGVATGPGVVNQQIKTAAAAATKQAQAPAQSQLPDGVDEMSILRQISDGLRLKNGRVQRAEIRLNPQELGTVRINMEMKGDAVRLVVSAEHAAVGELLSNGLEQLRKELLAQGMHVEHVEVRSELPGEGSQRDDSEREQGEGLEREANEASKTTQSGRRHRGQISVRA